MNLVNLDLRGWKVEVRGLVLVFFWIFISQVDEMSVVDEISLADHIDVELCS